MNEKINTVREWTNRAIEDIEAARRLGDTMADPLLKTSVYLCQQAAEKMVKALLVLNDKSFKYTHDIAPLVRLASEIMPEILKHIDTAEKLTPMATIHRYPGFYTERT